MGTRRHTSRRPCFTLQVLRDVASVVGGSAVGGLRFSQAQMRRQSLVRTAGVARPQPAPNGEPGQTLGIGETARKQARRGAQVAASCGPIVGTTKQRWRSPTLLRLRKRRDRQYQERHFVGPRSQGPPQLLEATREGAGHTGSNRPSNRAGFLAPKPAGPFPVAWCAGHNEPFKFVCGQVHFVGILASRDAGDVKG